MTSAGKAARGLAKRGQWVVDEILGDLCRSTLDKRLCQITCSS
jgi:hypothetical protein